MGRWIGGADNNVDFSGYRAGYLVVVTDEAIVLYEWTFAQGKGRKVATWPSNSYAAEKMKDTGEVGARITVDGGKIAILTGPRGPQHPAIRTTVDGIVRHAKLSAR